MEQKPEKIHKTIIYLISITLKKLLPSLHKPNQGLKKVSISTPIIK
jgi:hypothetical protein